MSEPMSLFRRGRAPPTPPSMPRFGRATRSSPRMDSPGIHTSQQNEQLECNGEGLC